jgi:hypothetical protein
MKPLLDNKTVIFLLCLNEIMGTNSSKSNEESSDEVGYRVLGVQANSPAAKGGLVSFFDFIVGWNGTPFQELDVSFVDLIKVCIR